MSSKETHIHGKITLKNFRVCRMFGSQIQETVHIGQLLCRNTIKRNNFWGIYLTNIFDCT